MNYRECCYYKGQNDSVGYCKLLETYCQQELGQKNFCPDDEDRPILEVMKETNLEDLFY